MARLAAAGPGGAHQGARGPAAGGADPGPIRLVAGRSQAAAAPVAALAWPGDLRRRSPALVRRRAAGGRGALLAKLFWLPQPATLHLGGEPPPAALVVFRPDAGGGQPAVHAAPADGASPGPGPRPVPSRQHFPGPVCRLLAAGGVWLFHPGRHQTAQLLVACHPGGRSTDRPGRPRSPRVAQSGPSGGVPLAGPDGVAGHPGPDGRALPGAGRFGPLDSPNPGPGDADPAGGDAGQWPGGAGGTLLRPGRGPGPGPGLESLATGLARGHAAGPGAVWHFSVGAADRAGGSGAPTAGAPDRRRGGAPAPPRRTPGHGRHPEALPALLHAPGGAL